MLPAALLLLACSATCGAAAETALLLQPDKDEQLPPEEPAEVPPSPEGSVPPHQRCPLCLSQCVLPRHCSWLGVLPCAESATLEARECAHPRWLLH